MRELIADAVAASPGIRVEIKRLLLAHALKPLPGNEPLVEALQQARPGASSASRSAVAARRCTPTCGCTASTASRPSIYGAGPRTVLESNAKRADEHLVLDDLRARHQGGGAHLVRPAAR